MNKRYDAEREIYLSGIIDRQGKILIYEKQHFSDFKEQNSGRRITIHAKAYDTQKKAAYLGYYHSVIIPRLVQANKDKGTLTNEHDLDIELRERCHLWECRPKKSGSGYDKRLRGLSELSDFELYEFINILKYIAAEYLNVIFDDPITF